MQKKNYLSIFALFFLSFYACTSNPLEIDVSAIDVSVQLARFEKDLLSKKNMLATSEIEQLATQYRPFFDDFTEQIINIGNAKSNNINYQLNAFVSDEYIQEIFNEVTKQYGSFSVYESQLTNAFKHYKHYFPNKEIPTIITYISGFNYAIATGENYLGIGLDMFLGKDYQPYIELQLPEYKREIMTKDYLVSSVLLGWISTEYEMEETQPNLLAEMVHQGKILYLLDALIPKEDNFKKLSYTEKQYNWCNQNKQQIWFYIMDNKLLFTKETPQIIKFMGEAPFTNGFPEGSPGRIGHWLGWEIVKAYMNKNPNVTLPELMQQTNAQEILNKSNYKPS